MCGHAHVARKGHGRKGARAWLCRGCKRRAEVADIFMSEYDEERVREIAAKANYRWGMTTALMRGCWRPSMAS